MKPEFHHELQEKIGKDIENSYTAPTRACINTPVVPAQRVYHFSNQIGKNEPVLLLQNITAPIETWSNKERGRVLLLN